MHENGDLPSQSSIVVHDFLHDDESRSLRPRSRCCNHPIYSQTRAQDAMRQLFSGQEILDSLGNLPPQPEIYPDQPAPIVRAGSSGGLAFARARWGLLTPPQYLVGRKVAPRRAFLITAPNAEVAVHPKAMPVILTHPSEWKTWLKAGWSEARLLQRPLPEGSLLVGEASADPAGAGG
uniref:SOS response-associated peptidase n=1 Tax=Cereibacter sphaeroides (strain ATCC 17025 / ATH 2.4.3) TaxID=349102 RepID=A4WYA2_CERS5